MILPYIKTSKNSQDGTNIRLAFSIRTQEKSGEVLKPKFSVLILKSKYTHSFSILMFHCHLILLSKYVENFRLKVALFSAQDAQNSGLFPSEKCMI